MAANTNDTNGSKVLPPTSMAHVVLKTPDLPKMSAFYKTFLGARASWEGSHMAFLTYDEEHHRIALLGVPGLAGKAHKSAGLDHIAFGYGSLADLLTAYKQRKALGILPVWSVNHGPTVSMYYADPDGNRLETQVDCFATVAETDAYMAGPEFELNPIGADVDPEELIRSLEAGVPEAVLMKRRDVGARGPESIPW